MRQFECTVTINRQVDEVFTVLTDPTRSPDWSRDAMSTLTPVEGGTRVDWTWRLNLAGPLRLLEGPMLAVFRRGFRSDLENLKELMVSGRIAAASSS